MMSHSSESRDSRAKKFILFLFSFCLVFLVTIIYHIETKKLCDLGIIFEEGKVAEIVSLLYFFILSLLLALVILTYREFLLAGETTKSYLMVFTSICLVLYLVEILMLSLSFLLDRDAYPNIFRDYFYLDIFKTLRFSSFLWLACTVLYVKNYLAQHKK
jgi:hypothetical protein